MAGLATPQTKSALLNAFPLESSAMCNKKAVLCTAFFVISVHCFVQARQCTATTKATHKSGFLVAHCARDSGGMVGFCARRAQRALFQTHSALTDAIFYTKILGSNSPDFFGNFTADFGHDFDKDSKIVLKKHLYSRKMHYLCDKSKEYIIQ